MQSDLQTSQWSGYFENATLFQLLIYQINGGAGISRCFDLQHLAACDIHLKALGSGQFSKIRHLIQLISVTIDLQRNTALIRSIVTGSQFSGEGSAASALLDTRSFL